MAGIVFDIVAGALDQLLGGGGSGQPVTVDDLAQPLEGLKAGIQIIDDIMQTADSATNAAVTAATDAADQVEKIGFDVRDIGNRIIDVIIPHSLSWTIGYVWSHGIVPLDVRVTRLERLVADLIRRMDALETWRRVFADPTLVNYRQWREWFDTWPQGVLFRWHDYFDHPDHFADWATPPLIGPIIGYLARPDHRQSRDNLSLIMTDAWSEVTNPTWEAILRFVVHDK